MKAIRGKQLYEMSAQEFAALRADYQTIWVDIGCGDGLYVYKAAQGNPGILCIGLEPAWKNASEISGKAMRKREKGGAANALFVAAALESPPQELAGLAQKISVNYPWGSLLRMLSRPEASALSGIRGMLLPGADFELHINYAVFEHQEDRAKLDLEPLDDAYLEMVLVPAYHNCGLVFLEKRLFSGRAAVRTSWGAQLSLGSGRKTLYLRFRTESVRTG